MIVDQALVRRLAELARLELSADEVATLAGDLERVLAHVEMLRELDVEGVAPLASVAAASPGGGMRPDEPRPSFSVGDALASAPRSAEGGFAVPRFVDEA